MDIPEWAAWTLKDLNSFEVENENAQARQCLLSSRHFKLQSDQATRGSMLLLLIRLYPSISFCFKAPDNHSITCSALKCPYFPLSEPTPCSQLPSREPTLIPPRPQTQTNDSPKNGRCVARGIRSTCCAVCSCEIQPNPDSRQTTATIHSQIEREKTEPRATPQTRKTTRTLTPSASSPPAQSPRQSPSPPPPTA